MLDSSRQSLQLPSSVCLLLAIFNSLKLSYKGGVLLTGAFDQFYECLSVIHELAFLFYHFFSFEAISRWWQLVRHIAVLSRSANLGLFRFYNERLFVFFFLLHENSELLDVRRFNRHSSLNSLEVPLFFIFFYFLCFVVIYHVLRLPSKANGFVIVERVVVSRIIRLEDIIGFLVVFQLEVEVLDYLVCSFHFFVVDGDFLVKFGLNVYELLDLGHIFNSAWPILEQSF